MAIQRVSWRDRRATDFRAVQGAVAADGLGNLLSGLFATVPNTTYSNSVSIVDITGVAARRVGVCIGVIFVALAFLPKATAVLLAIPNPVVGAYVLVLIAILFVLGLEMVAQDGIDYRKATIVGVSFWIGAGFQNGQIPSEIFGTWVGTLLENGMTSGGLTAILLSGFMEWLGPRRRRMDTKLDLEALPQIHGFLERFGSRAGLSNSTMGRVSLAAEETLLVLIDQLKDDELFGTRRLRVTARADSGAAEMEFLAVAGEGNIEDRLALVSGRPSEEPAEHEFSLRLLHHIATSVRHQKYHDTDIVSIRVDPTDG
jgi:NCS2 family nucleobase:cation symporter-2/xanthine permease XanP